MAPRTRPARQTWLLVTLSTSGSRSGLRVYAWRTLRSLGALYLQQAVAVLPERDETLRRVEQLVTRLLAEGAAAQFLRIEFADRSEEGRVVDALQAERADEYREVIGRCPSFLQELATERAKGRTTYTEFEESQADFRRLRTWFKKVRARDYFGAPGAAEAGAAIRQCHNALLAFEKEALAAETMTPRRGRHLRSVTEA